MTILYQYNCDDSATAPTVGTNNSVTTVNSTVNSRNSQYSVGTLNSEANKIISIPPESVSNVKGIIKFDARLDYDTSLVSGSKLLFGQFRTQDGSFIINENITASLGTLFFQLDIVAPTITVAWEWASIPALNTIHNDGLFHDFEFTYDSVSPVSGSDHITFKLDGVLIAPTTGARTTAWTPSAFQFDFAFLGNAIDNLLSNFDAYIDNILILDTVIIPGITVDEPTYKYYPYGDTETADIPLSGTYGVAVPTHIEARWFRRDTTATVQDWTAVSTEVIGGGNWSGTCLDVPKTKAWLGVEVRASNNTGITDTTANDTAVGFIAVGIGQSNMDNMFDVGTGTPNDLTSMYTKAGAWETMTGAGAITLANQLVDDLGCPVAIMAFGYDGSSLIESNAINTDWWYEGNISLPFSALEIAIAAIGGKAHHIIWYQGATDATDDPTNYESTEALFFNNQLRGLITNPKTGTLPATVCLLARWSRTTIPSTDVKWSAVSKAKLNNYDAGVFQNVITPIDQVEDVDPDTGHLTAPGYIAVGDRFARAIAKTEGIYSTYRSPRAVGYNIINNTTIDVLLDLDYGTDFTPTAAIDSFVVDIGSGFVATTGARVDSTTVRLTHAPGTAITLASMYGQFFEEAPTAFILKDNSALALPILQDSSIPVSAGVALISQDITTGAPTIGSPTLSVLGDVELIAQDITTGAPTIGQPTLNKSTKKAPSYRTLTVKAGR